MAGTHRVGISIPEEEFQALQGKAQMCGVTISWLTKQAVLEFLARYRDRDLRLPLVTPDGQLAKPEE